MKKSLWLGLFMVFSLISFVCADGQDSSPGIEITSFTVLLNGKQIDGSRDVHVGDELTIKVLARNEKNLPMEFMFVKIPLIDFDDGFAKRGVFELPHTFYEMLSKKYDTESSCVYKVKQEDFDKFDGLKFWVSVKAAHCPEELASKTTRRSFLIPLISSRSLIEIDDILIKHNGILISSIETLQETNSEYLTHLTLCASSFVISDVRNGDRISIEVNARDSHQRPLQFMVERDRVFGHGLSLEMSDQGFFEFVVNEDLKEGYNSFPLKILIKNDDSYVKRHSSVSVVQDFDDVIDLCLILSWKTASEILRDFAKNQEQKNNDEEILQNESGENAPLKETLSDNSHQDVRIQEDSFHNISEEMNDKQQLMKNYFERKKQFLDLIEDYQNLLKILAGNEIPHYQTAIESLDYFKDSSKNHIEQLTHLTHSPTEHKYILSEKFLRRVSYDIKYEVRKIDAHILALGLGTGYQAVNSINKFCKKPEIIRYQFNTDGKIIALNSYPKNQGVFNNNCIAMGR